METKQRQRSERFKRKALARWRLLATRGVSLEEAALEIGVTAAELRAWVRGTEDEAPLLVPVQVTEDEAPLLVPVQVTDVTAERRALVVFAGGLRVEGLTVAEVAELVRRLS